MLYLTLKMLHVIFIVCWFAGLFYLPRIFVNLAMVPVGSDAEYRRLLMMARKLFIFMSPLGMLALLFGVWIWYVVYPLASGWLHVKTLLAIFLVAYHGYCFHLLRAFRRGENRHSHRWYRFFNEIPVLILLAAIYLAVFKPF